MDERWRDAPQKAPQKGHGALENWSYAVFGRQDACWTGSMACMLAGRGLGNGAEGGGEVRDALPWIALAHDLVFRCYLTGVDWRSKLCGERPTDVFMLSSGGINRLFGHRQGSARRACVCPLVCVGQGLGTPFGRACYMKRPGETVSHIVGVLCCCLPLRVA